VYVEAINDLHHGVDPASGAYLREVIREAIQVAVALACRCESRRGCARSQNGLHSTVIRPLLVRDIEWLCELDGPGVTRRSRRWPGGHCSPPRIRLEPR